MRLGPHVNTPHRANVAADYIRAVKPNACKVLDSGMDGRVIDAARETGAAIIGRVYWDSQKLGAEYGRFTGRVVAFAHQFPHVAYLEGANEDFQGGDELSRYAVHEIERMKALEAIGRKAIIGNFSCGQPQYGEWSRFRPALEYAAAHGHVLGLHEYSGPVMQWMAGNNQIVGGAHRLDDAGERQGLTGHLTLRYRHVLKLAREWGIGNLQIAITESGIDDVNPRPGPQGKGWRSYVGTQYADMAPFGDYSRQLAWYGRRLSEDANVVAWVDFGFSQAGDWQTFDLSEDGAMRDRVIAEMQRMPRTGSSIPAPTPQPAPSPAPVPPPAPTAGPFAAIEVAKGEGRDSVARRAYSLPTRPVATVKDAVRRIEGANPGKDWGPGARLRVPGLKVVKGD